MHIPQAPPFPPPSRFLAHFPEEMVEMAIFAANRLLNFGLTSKNFHLLSHDPRLWDPQALISP